MFQKPRTPIAELTGFAWNTATSVSLQAAIIPLPGFPELQHTANSLIDGVKIQGYSTEQCALLSRRINRLLCIVQEFGGAQFLDLSELSRQLYHIKVAFEDENKRPTRTFGMSSAERRLSMLDNLRDELSGLVEATQLRMLSQAIRTNQAQEEGQTITQKSELQATKAELEQVRAYMAEIKQKNRELQDLMDDAHAHWVEMSLLEESKEAELKRKDMELFRLRDELRQVKHEVGRLQKVAKDHEEEAEKKNQALQELKHNVEVYQSEIACLKDAKEDELRWKDMASLQVQNELRQVKSEVECLQKAAKGREAEIEEKNRAIQILTDDAHARWIEMSQLEDKKNYQLRQKDMTLLQLRNDLRQVRNEVKCLRKAAKDQKAEVEKKDLVFWQELVDDTQTHQREISRVEARKEELTKGQ